MTKHKRNPFDNRIPELDEPFTCPHCGFGVDYMDTIERRFKEVDGTHVRGGVRFTCKNCERVVLEVVDVIS